MVASHGLRINRAISPFFSAIHFGQANKRDGLSRPYRFEERRIAQGIKLYAALAAAGVLVACAPAETGTADGAPTITLSKLVVDEKLEAGVRYEVTLPYEVSGEGSIVVRKACFRWSGEGPYCFDARHDKGSKTVKLRLRTNNPNVYRLAGYVEYTSNGSAKKSNVVAQMINVE